MDRSALVRVPTCVFPLSLSFPNDRGLNGTKIRDAADVTRIGKSVSQRRWEQGKPASITRERHSSRALKLLLIPGRMSHEYV